MDYIIAIDDAQVREVVKPFVEIINAGSQLMFADSDFVYTQDEFMRDVPGRYELKIGWCEGFGQWDGTFLITTLTLTHPQRLNTTKLDVGKRLESLNHPHVNQVLGLIGRQIAAGQAEDRRPDMPDDHFLRLSW